MDPLTWIGLYLIIGIACGVFFTTGKNWSGGNGEDVAAFVMMALFWLPIFVGVIAFSLVVESLAWIADKRGFKNRD